jgi:WD40 repeat protein
LEVIAPDNVARIEQLAELPISGATQLAFSPGGGEFAIGKDDGSIEMWSAVTGRLLMKVRDGEENRPVRQLGFTSDGTLLLSSTSETGANNPVTFVWEPATGEMVHSYSESPAALSPDGRFLAIVTGSANKSVEIVDLATGEVVITLAEPNELYLLGLAYSADGLWLVGSAAGVDRSGTTIWQAENGELLGTLDEVSNLTLSPSSFQAAASDMSQLSIYDTESWTVIQELSGDGDLKFSSIGYSTDGSFVAGAFGDRVKLFSTDTWQESAVLPAKNVYGISFSPDQRLMASYTFGGSVQLWGIISEASVESGPPVSNLVNRQQLMDLAWAALDPNTSSHNQADWEVVEVRQATGHEVSGYFSAEPELACPGPEPPANKLIDPSTTYGFVDMRPWPATPVSPDPPISPTAPPNVPEPFLQRALFLLDLDSGQIIARALSCIIY